MARDLLLAAKYGKLKDVEDFIKLNPGASVDAPLSIHGSTPLFAAVLNGHLAVVKALIAAGDDVNTARTIDNVTPLYFAAQENHIEIVKVLLTAGANVNCTFIDGYTPLLIAAQSGHIEVVEALINAGANVSATLNTNSNTALSIATKHGHRKIINLLRQAQALKFDDKLNDEDDIPDNIRCRISRRIMRDPVTVSSGITYDRESLRDLFAKNNNPGSVRCPITRKFIHNRELDYEPGDTVLNLIKGFVARKDNEKIAQKNWADKKPKTDFFNRRTKLSTSAIAHLQHYVSPRH